MILEIGKIKDQYAEDRHVRDSKAANENLKAVQDELARIMAEKDKVHAEFMAMTDL